LAAVRAVLKRNLADVAGWVRGQILDGLLILKASVSTHYTAAAGIWQLLSP
jgi:hypothetical protein